MSSRAAIILGQNIRTLIQGSGLRAQLFRRGIGSIVVKASGMLLSLALAIILARTLGPEGYGIYTYTFALVSLLAIPAQLGLPALVIRETAKAQASENWGLMRGCWRWATLVASALSLTLTFISSAIAWILANNFADIQLTTFALGLLLIPLITLGNLRGAALQGLRHVVLGQLPETLVRPGILLYLLGITTLFWPSGSLTAAGAMALHGLAAAIAFTTGVWLLWRTRPAPIQANPAPVYHCRSWLASTLPLAFIAGMGIINQQTDILMLGFFTTADKIGIYRVSLQGASLVSFGLTAIGMVTWPYFARFHEQGDMASFQKVATLSARGMLSLALPFTIIFIIFGEGLLNFIFGRAYTDAYLPLIILAIANMIHAAFGTVGPLLNMTGNEKTTAKGIAIAASCNIFFNLILIPYFSILGAAIATSIALVIWNFVLWRAVRHKLGVDSSVFNLTNYYK
jgi:O-antigen/teichoic acid export membrane protein